MKRFFSQNFFPYVDGTDFDNILFESVFTAPEYSFNARRSGPIFATSGDDTIIATLPAEDHDGMGGFDIVSYADSTAGVFVRLWNGTGQFGFAEDDTFTSIEGIIGSAFADTLIGSGLANTLRSGAGNDYIHGLSGDDTLEGGAGADTIIGGDGFDTADYSNSGSGVFIRLWNGTGLGGEAEGDTLNSIEGITGSAFADTLIGNNGVNETLRGGAGNDYIHGLSGDDILEGGAGADILEGGDGFDIADYSGSTAAITFRLWNQTVTGGDGQGDVISGFEGVIGTNFEDTIIGTNGADTLRGGDGDDYIHGLSGNDIMEGGAGADQIIGYNYSSDMQTASYENSDAAVIIRLWSETGQGGHAEGDTLIGISGVIGSAFSDTIIGSARTNILRGGDGDDYLNGLGSSDTLIGGLGADTVVGGEGIDTADYSDSNAGVTISMFNGTASGGHAEGDTLISIEGIIGSNFADAIVDTVGDDTIMAGGGNDFIFGLGGDDIFDGGDGFDTLDFSSASVGVQGAYGTTVRHFESVIWSDHGDTILGLYPDTVVLASEGGDFISNYTLYGGIRPGIRDRRTDGTVDYSASTEGINITINGEKNGSLISGTGGLAQGDRLVDIKKIIGTAFDDTIIGDGFSLDNRNQAENIFDSGAGDDYLDGGYGEDIFIAGTGDDTILGREGHDYIYGGEGADNINGGGNNDTIDYSASTAGITLNLNTGAASGGHAEGDTVLNVEHVIGTAFDDNIIGFNSDYRDPNSEIGFTPGNNILTGGGGNDILQGFAGYDTLRGDEGDDSLFGGDDNDTLQGGNGADILDGGDGTDMADYSTSSAAVIIRLWNGTGSGGDAEGDTLNSIEKVRGSGLGDTLIGSNSSTGEHLSGEAGADYIHGLSGDDTLNGGLGDDTLVGGGGFDIFEFRGEFGNDTITDFDLDASEKIDLETLVGSYANLTASHLSEVNGNSVITIGANTITITSITNAELEESDFIFGGVSAEPRTEKDDTPVQDSDISFAASGDDTTIAALPAEDHDGMGGFDIVSYVDSTSAVFVRLWNGTGQFGFAEGDTFTSIEGIIGSAFADTLIGANGTSETLRGGAGDDYIAGLSGDDILEGGAGADTLYGGDGFDRAVYSQSSEAVTIRLWNGTGEGGDAEGDTLSGIEAVLGSAFSDTLIGSSGSDSISGSGGDDYINSLDGNDYIHGGTGDDTIWGGYDVDIIYGGDGDDLIYGIGNGRYDLVGNYIDGGAGNDTIYAGTGPDHILGGAGDDFIDGASGGQRLEGGDGDDYIRGLSDDADILIGGAGADRLVGKLVNSRYYEGDTANYEASPEAVYVRLWDGTGLGGHAEGDTLLNIQNLTGSAFSDTLIGSSDIGNILSGGDGDDYINGLSGNDTLNGGAGADTLVGDSGFDIVDYSDSDAGVIVTLFNSSASGGHADGDTLVSIEGVIGSDHNDAIAGYAFGELIISGAGDDFIFGSLGADDIRGGSGIDTIDYSASAAGVNIRVGGFSGSHSGGDAEGDFFHDIEIIIGSAHNDTIRGGTASYLGNITHTHRIVGGDGHDTLYGDDRAATILVGGSGVDRLYGLGFDDIADYSDSSEGVSISLSTGRGQFGDAAGDTLTDIRHVVGSAFDDTFNGSDWSETFEGGGGADLINGSNNTAFSQNISSYQNSSAAVTINLTDGTASGGDAQGDILTNIQGLIGSDHDDHLTGTDPAFGVSGDNSLDGGAGNDTLYGLGGDDRLTGGSGADYINGGDGTDTVNYSGSSSGVVVKIWNNTSSGGDAEGDVLVSIENVSGSEFGDTLIGSNNIDYLQILQGLGGDDYIHAVAGRTRIHGGDGDDTLYGGTGSNRIYGGEGNDTLYAGTGENTLHGEEGNDTLYAGTGQNTLHGDEGNDYLYGAGRYDTLYGGEGDDYIYDGGIRNHLYGGNGNDHLFGLVGSSQLLGGNGNDKLYGGDFENTMLGEAGDDLLNGGGGDDQMSGGDGNDYLVGGAGKDTYYFASGFGHDTIEDFDGDILKVRYVTMVDNFEDFKTSHLTQTDGNSVITIGDDSITLLGVTNAELDADDFIFAGSATEPLSAKDLTDMQNSNIFMTDGDDVIIAALPAEDHDGMGGFDIISYVDSTTGVFVRLWNGTGLGGFAEGDTFTSIEGIIGSAFADILIGSSSQSDTLHGGDGNDYIHGLSGDDTLEGGAGADTLEGGDGTDTVDYSGSSSAVTVRLWNGTGEGGDAQGDTLVSIENLTGSAFNDVIIGSNDISNTLRGGDGFDYINGLSGDDIIEGGAGGDTIEGGDGFDTADYSGSDAAVTIRTWNNTVEGGHAEGDTLTSIEAFIGSEFSDTMIGSGNLDDVFYGGGGNDYINGVGGNDKLYGGAGDDRIEASGDINHLYGGSGNDHIIGKRGYLGNFLFGGDGDDILEGSNDSTFTFHGGAGADRMSGGAFGYDSISYEGSSESVVVRLWNQTAQGGDAEGDIISGIEIVIGSDFSDTLIGSSDVNTLIGGAGDDYINGLSGNDTLRGGQGADVLVGDDGFDYADYSDSNAGITATLYNSQVTGGYATGDTLISIEGIIGSDHGDAIAGTVFGDSIKAGGGDDFVFGLGGADELDGGDGTDTLDYSSSSERVIINLLEDTFQGGDAEGNIAVNFEIYIGSAHDDYFQGGLAYDTFVGGEGADYMRGRQSYDNPNDIRPDLRAYDRADYSASDAGINITINGDAGTGGHAEGDRLYKILDVVGSDYDDVISLTEVHEISYFYRFDSNTLYGGAGNDRLFGGEANDTLDGGSGDRDFADYSTAGKVVNVDLGKGLAVVGTYVPRPDMDNPYAFDLVPYRDTLINIEGVIGGASHDSFIGTNSDATDIFFGNGGDDFFNGLAGDDIFNGGDGEDTFRFESGFGHDTIEDFGGDIIDLQSINGIDSFATLLTSHLTEVDGNSVITIGDNSITLLGVTNAELDSDDFIFAGSAAERLSAKDDKPVQEENIFMTTGDDTIIAALPAENHDGMGGFDIVSYVDSTSAVFVRLWNGTGQFGFAEGDTFTSIEGIIGSAFADTLIGANGTSETLRGGAGDDYIAGLSGDDILEGGAGADTIVGGDGFDTADYSGSSESVFIRLWNGTGLGGDAEGDTLSSVEAVIGSAFSDTLIGRSGASDTLRGGEGADYIHGLSGDDTLEGGAGDDTIIGGSGADILNGGDGFDTADYSGSSAAITIRTWNGVNEGGDAEGDILSNIESIIGTAFGDTLIGSNDLDNVFYGGDGADYIDGLGGNNTIHGGAGNDVINGSNFVYPQANTVTVYGDDGDDTINSNGGINYLYGGNGDDVISCYGYENYLYGGDGNDHLIGGRGINELRGGAGDDILDGDNNVDDWFDGGSGADTINGGHGAHDTVSYEASSAGVFVRLWNGVGLGGDAEGDILSSIEDVTGSGFSDTLIGSADRANILIGGDGDDYLNGLSGDDIIIGGAGADTIVGDAGFDTADYSESDAGITISLFSGAASGGHAEGDTLSSIEKIIGSDHGDAIAGTTGDDIILAGGGDDYVFGLGGNDTLDGGSGYDILDNSSSINAINMGPEGTSITGFEFIIGTDFNDILQGENGVYETFRGGAGADTITGYTSNSPHPSGATSDAADYSDSTAGITISLNGGTGSGGYAEGDTLIRIRDLIGSEYNDVLTGNSSSDRYGDETNRIEGLGGNDTIRGLDGRDTLLGGDGDDILYGGDGSDMLIGGAGADTIYGDGEDSGTFQSPDTVSYEGSTSGVTVNLDTGVGSGGHAEGDQIIDVQFLTGSAHDDVLIGVDSDFYYRDIDTGQVLAPGYNRIHGGDGNDRIEGLKGNDSLYGDAGNDQIFGGLGKDYILGGTGNDYISGDSGDDNLYGADGDDFIVGGTGNDNLYGGQGFDTFVIHENAGSETIHDFDLAAAEKIDLSAITGVTDFADVQANYLTEVDGDSVITITGTTITLLGITNAELDADDFIFAGSAAQPLNEKDTTPMQDINIFMTDGNDTIIAALPAENHDGMGGFDIVSYVDSTAGVFVRLWNGTGLGGYAEGDTFTSIEGIIGSAFRDTLIGASGTSETLRGGDGDDYIHGLSGDDTLEGGAGADTLEGGDGFDIADYSSSSAGVFIRLWNGTGLGGEAEGDILTSIEGITGSAFADTLIGNNGVSETLRGGSGDDYIHGLSGDDILEGGAGADTLEGGDGFDIADYSGSTAAVTIRVWNNTVEGGDAQGDVLSGIEGFIGSSFSDTIIGANTNDVLYGGDGNDYINSLDGADLIYGGAGNDDIYAGTGPEGSRHEIYGGAGNDTINANADENHLFGGDGDDFIYGTHGTFRSSGGNGNDIMYGSGNDDWFSGGAGADAIHGHSGAHDTISFEESSAGVFVRLWNGTGLGGDAEGDTYYTVEDVIGSAFSDTLIGHYDEDNILIGGAGDDYLNGLSGDDTIIGGVGADTIVGGDGTDTTDYSASDAGITVSLFNGTASGGHAEGDTLISIEVLIGTQFADALAGTTGNDTIHSGGGNDLVYGLGGDDVISTGAGDDTLFAGSGAGVFDGGDGFDTLDYSSAGGGVTARLGTQIINFESIILSNHDDTIHGAHTVASIIASEGADTIYGVTFSSGPRGTVDYSGSSAGILITVNTGTGIGGLAEGDRLYNIETIIGSDFNDSLTGDDGQYSTGGFHQFGGSNTLYGGAGNDSLNGGDGDDKLYGGIGNDIINGDYGDDIIYADEGADQINGGFHVDTLDYSTSTAGINVNLETGSASTGGLAEGDTVTNVENIIGTDFDDHIIGIDSDRFYMDYEGSRSFAFGANTLNGGDGNDILEGLAGNDTLYGDNGNDDLYGGAHRDYLFGGDGNDLLSGGDGNDDLTGGIGADALDGGEGTDTAYYTDSDEGVLIRLWNGTGVGGTAEGDTLTSIEIIHGSDFSDIIIGSSSATGETLYGNGGGDYINGLGGNDKLYGGAGNDYMVGGTGSDTFYIQSGFGQDTIEDFDVNGEVISLRDVNGITSFFNLQNFFLSEVNGNSVITVGANTLTIVGVANADLEENDFIYSRNAAQTLIKKDTTPAQGDNSITLLGVTNAELDATDFMFAGSPAQPLNEKDTTLMQDTNIFMTNGDDTIIAALAAEDHDGMNGFDIVSYADSTTGVFVRLWNGTGLGGYAEGDTFTSIEGIIGSAFADTLIGSSSQSDTLRGGDGNDYIHGLSGDDTLEGGAGADTLEGGDGIDTADYSTSGMGVTVNLSTGAGLVGDAAGDTLISIERLIGSLFADTLTGSAANNTFVGGAGADTLNGGNGNDTLIGGQDADTLDGGAGLDTADYSTSAAGILVRLWDGTGEGGDAEGDTLTSIERVIGTNFGDAVAGSNFSDDTLIGGGGNDFLYGINGDDTLIGGSGADVLDGGGGIDIADYSDNTSGITAKLWEDSVSGGEADGDTIVSIEGIIGTAFSDLIIGANNEDNILHGGAGNDQIYGLSGDDYISGGAGTDYLNGGDGFDIVDYSDSNGRIEIDLFNNLISGGHGEGDTIRDFEGVIGSGLNDILVGGGRFDTYIDGGAGDDIISSGRGTSIGGEGSDYFIGSAWVDYTTSDAAVTIDLTTGTGSGGNAEGDTFHSSVSRIRGSLFDDILTAQPTSGSRLDGGAGNDTLIGSSVDDVLIGGLGIDSLDGGDGSDTADYSESNAAVIIRLWNGTGEGGHAEGDTLTSIEAVIGSAFSDAIVGSSFQDDILEGGDGNDFIYGLFGDDTLIGGSGADVLNGGGGNDTIKGGTGADVLTGGAGTDTLDYSDSSSGINVSLETETASGGDGEGDSFTGFEIIIGSTHDDTLTGGDLTNDVLTGGGGVDHLIGLGGDDILASHTQSTTFDGGEGFDIMDLSDYYSNQSIGLNVKLWEENEKIISIEGVIGSQHADVLVGSFVANTIKGMANSDLIYGLAGNDRLEGGDGSDTIYGGDDDDHLLGGENGFGPDRLHGESGNDTLEGGAGDDELYGGIGNDILQGDEGDDELYGGDGIDIASYSNSSDGVTVKLWNGTGTGGDAHGDTYDSIEGVTGSAHSDTLVGSSLQGDILSGGGGNDFMYGLAGDDTLNGGAGNDRLNGGDGFDTFIFTGEFGNDIIENFNLDAAEKIDLSALVASYTDLTTNHLTESGGNSVITIGTNTITIIGVTNAELDADDFILANNSAEPLEGKDDVSAQDNSVTEDVIGDMDNFQFTQTEAQTQDATEETDILPESGLVLFADFSLADYADSYQHTPYGLMLENWDDIDSTIWNYDIA